MLRMSNFLLKIFPSIAAHFCLSYLSILRAVVFFAHPLFFPCTLLSQVCFPVNNKFCPIFIFPSQMRLHQVFHDLNDYGVTQERHFHSKPKPVFPLHPLGTPAYAYWELGLLRGSSCTVLRWLFTPPLGPPKFQKIWVEGN